MKIAVTAGIGKRQETKIVEALKAFPIVGKPTIEPKDYSLWLAYSLDEDKWQQKRPRADGNDCNSTDD